MINHLKERLRIEFEKQDRSGIYGYTQRNLAYNSNKIEGSTLTEKQTANLLRRERSWEKTLFSGQKM